MWIFIIITILFIYTLYNPITEDEIDKNLKIKIILSGLDVQIKIHSDLLNNSTDENEKRSHEQKLQKLLIMRSKVSKL